MDQYSGKISGERIAAQDGAAESADATPIMAFLAPLPPGTPWGVHGQMGNSSDPVPDDLSGESSSGSDSMLSASPLPPCQGGCSGGDKAGWIPEGIFPPGLSPALPTERGTPFSSSPENPEPMEQGVKAGRVEPVQDFVAGIRPQAGEGSLFPVTSRKGTSSDFPAVPVGPVDSGAGENPVQGRIGPSDSPIQEKEGLSHSGLKERFNREGSPLEGGGKQPLPAEPSAKAIDEASLFSGMKSAEIAKLSSGQAWESPTPGHGEKESFSFPAFRHPQVSTPGKESQTIFGLYGISTDASALAPGFIEKMVEGKEGPAQGRFEPQGIYQQVGERVLWLIRNQEEKIRISLDPPELGHLYLEISRSKESIQTLLLTDNPATKATLESSQMEIQRIIESEGFKLEKFDVLVQQDLGRFQEGRESRFHAGSGSSFSPGRGEGSSPASTEPLVPVPRRMHPASQYLDLFV